MIAIKQAFEIRKQILNGQWVGCARSEYEFKPEKIQCYKLENGNCELWVANGLLFLELKFKEAANYRYVKLPFICKLIIYGPAMRMKYTYESKELKRVRAAAKLAVDVLTKML
jgi:hypothetical protein